jgi:hypothetical protein
MPTTDDPFETTENPEGPTAPTEETTEYPAAPTESTTEIEGLY